MSERAATDAELRAERDRWVAHLRSLRVGEVATRELIRRAEDELKRRADIQDDAA